jgi:uncharacterized membrane protein
MKDLGTLSRHAGKIRGLALAAGAVAVMGFMAAPAEASLKICNNSESRVGAAIGYKDQEGWVTEGWWTMEPGKCVKPLSGNLPARYYYVFAIDYTKGGSWGGNAMMCTRDKLFTIRGIEDCEKRGFRKTGFFEVDTGESEDWTVSLGEKTTQGQ